MNDFERSMTFINRVEGGKVELADGPRDANGLVTWQHTNRGITQATWDGYLESRSLTASVRPDVWDAYNEEIVAIYHKDYWLAGRCDEMPWPISLAHMDGCVQHGPKQAGKVLQRGLNVLMEPGLIVDGIVGPKTLQSVDDWVGIRSEDEQLTDELLWQRLRLYRVIAGRDKSKRQFSWIWEDRLLKLRKAVVG